MQEEKGSTSGLKRTLSEGFDDDTQSVKREGKRPKREHEELEAQLELKITAKAGSHHKLGKVNIQLNLRFSSFYYCWRCICYIYYKHCSSLPAIFFTDCTTACG